MTDEPDDMRAERAFRSALSQRAEALETVPLEAGGTTGRRRWLPAVVAAAVLLLVGGTVLAAGVLGDDGGGKPTAIDQVPVGALPAADDGWRWVSWRDVAIQVPAEWADGYEPRSDWCGSSDVERKLPPDPYVSRNQSAGAVNDIGCPEPDDGRPEVFGPVPQDHWAPHLTFVGTDTVEGPPDGVTEFAGWRIETTTIDTVQLQLWTDADTADLADPILRSVRTFTTDNNGCDITSPVQTEEFVRPPRPFHVNDLESVDSISVCQYERHLIPNAAALMSSRRLEGTAAEDLLAGIKSAPTGGGPDYPNQCTHDMYGDHAIALRFHHDGVTDDAYVYYDWCFGNGIDDGTTRYQLTENNCAPLFGDGLTAWQYQSALRNRCG